MPSRVRFTLPSSSIKAAHFEYTFERACACLSFPSSCFDSTLETLHEDSELELHQSFDHLERVEKDESKGAIILTRQRKPFTPIPKRIVEEKNKNAKD